jgi:hypothetical protein
VTALDEAVAGLADHPSWNVQRGIGSFLMLEFGTPRLEVAALGDIRREIAGRSRLVRQRHASVRGEWSLWIKDCAWSLSWIGHELAHSESSRTEIDRALAVLNGQILIAADIIGADTSLTFDLGCALKTRPYDEPSRDDEQWLLFQPCGTVLTLSADGRLESGRAHEA